MTTLPPLEDLRVGDAHIIGRRDASQGGTVLPSGILASRIDLTLRITVDREPVEPRINFGPRVEAPINTTERTSAQPDKRRTAHRRVR
ncbi:hypothetical protein CIK73_06070 [Brachybacterium alimentarium]|uniref:hypothetical protein n=1 Tax=Brachybacterium alimentarium TaxID=47845 RepID=UPI000DF41EA7|nr:hypothetical protein [Brachybacterium alimentarium]RCS69486.1 hypothetical protein CIK73_06070 [Brachybacterium alimentarium]